MNGSATARGIRPASTLVLLRDAAGGVDVLMLRRAQAAAFLGGAYVFPGGAVDASDGDAKVLERIRGLSAADADRRLGMPGGALRHWVAALRECFEEAGILVARDASGALIQPARMAGLRTLRAGLHRGEVSFAEVLERERLFLHADDLVYADHWITPAGRPRRFDTRFFIARSPAGHDGSADRFETIEAAWMRAASALALAERGEIELAFATRTLLHGLQRHGTVAAALAEARGRAHIETKRPVVAQGAGGPVIFRAGDPAYAEVRWSDPDETTQTTCDLVPGVPKRLDRLVTRVIAPNPGVMTGPGTNTYLIGDRELAVVDPGPALDAHVAAVLAAGAGRIRWIFCTHTHRDHSPASAALKAATGATVVGAPAPAEARQDEGFRPDVVPADGAACAIGGATLRALHTPGHASNHYCYLLEETRMLFSGDHVMQGSTVIVNPPDGDMGAYVISLRRLLAQDVAVIAPGHGYLIGTPHAEIRRLIEHRRLREETVLRALERSGAATVEELLPVVYADVPVDRHRAAARSLLAHLLKLAADGRVREADGRYRMSSA